MTLRNITFNVTEGLIPGRGAPRVIALDQVEHCNNVTGCGSELYNDGSHNFGFRATFPNLIMDNITVNSSADRETSLMPIYYLPTAGTHPYYFGGNIIIRNVRNADGRAVELFPHEITIDRARFGNTDKTNMYIFNTKIAADTIFSGDNLQFTLLLNYLPQIRLETNGGAAAGTHSTVVNVNQIGLPIKNSSLRYVWSQSTTAPADALFTNTFTNGDTITRNTGNGTWYLWIMAEDTLGNSIKEMSRAFQFNNVPPTPPTTQAPPVSTPPRNQSGTSSQRSSGTSGQSTPSENIVDDGSQKIEIVEREENEVPRELAVEQSSRSGGMPIWAIVGIFSFVAIPAVGGYILYLRPRIL